MVSRLLRSLCVAGLLLTAAQGSTQEQAFPEFLVKARFLARVASYCEWPPAGRVADKSRPFLIGVLGRSDLEPHLRSELRRIGTLKGKAFEIKLLRSLSHLDQCDLLFVAGSEQDRLEAILAQVEGKPVLTIADTPDFGRKGVMFNLFVKQERLVFEVNLTSLRKAGLEVDTQVVLSANNRYR
jgi:hypothetical protein